MSSDAPFFCSWPSPPSLPAGCSSSTRSSMTSEGPGPQLQRVPPSRSAVWKGLLHSMIICRGLLWSEPAGGIGTVGQTRTAVPDCFEEDDPTTKYPRAAATERFLESPGRAADFSHLRCTHAKQGFHERASRSPSERTARQAEHSCANWLRKQKKFTRRKHGSAPSCYAPCELQRRSRFLFDLKLATLFSLFFLVHLTSQRSYSSQIHPLPKVRANETPASDHVRVHGEAWIQAGSSRQR